jgi:hypothetical protein
LADALVLHTEEIIMRRIRWVCAFLLFGTALAEREANAYSQPVCTTGTDGNHQPYDICPNSAVPPSITNTGYVNGSNGGNLLSHPEIAPIFWGNYWSQNLSVRGQVVGFIQSLVNGAYLDQLEEYGLSYGSSVGFARARMSPIAPTVVQSNGASFTNVQAATMINQLIGSGAVAPPSTGAQMVYSVFVNPGWVDSDFGGATPGGYNEAEICDSDCGPATSRWIAAPRRSRRSSIPASAISTGCP